MAKTDGGLDLGDLLTEQQRQNGKTLYRPMTYDAYQGTHQMCDLDRHFVVVVHTMFFSF